MFPTDVAIRYVYNSNRLDGVSLSEEQTRGILDGSIVKGEDDVPSADGKEWDVECVLSHRKALERVAELATAARRSRRR